MNEPKKYCSKCNELKPLTEYHKNKNCKDGINARCKVCRREDENERVERLRSRKHIDYPETKRCSTCKKTKNSSEFHKKRTTADGLSWQCKMCHHKNIDQRRSNKYNAFKSTLGGCKICGELRTWVLIFHHINPDNKRKGFKMEANNFNSHTEEYMEEIKKCILICRNCHSNLHYIHTRLFYKKKYLFASWLF